MVKILWQGTHPTTGINALILYEAFGELYLRLQDPEESTDITVVRDTQQYSKDWYVAVIDQLTLERWAPTLKDKWPQDIKQRVQTFLDSLDK